MHHGGPPLPHGGYPPQHPRGYGGPPPHTARGTKRSHAERDEGGYGGRHDYPGHWGGGGGYEDQHRPKRKGSNEERERFEERPRILIKHEDKQSGRVSPEKKPESPLEAAEKSSSVSSFQRTLSSSSDPSVATEAPRHRVTFVDDVIESPIDKDSGNVPPPQGSSRRALSKIMLRKMGEKDGELPGEKGSEVGQGTGGVGRQGRSGDTDTVAESSKPKMAWSTNERGPIVSSKTLYEPEGKQSAAKFKKYQAQTREPPGNRGSHDLATPTSEGTATPTGEQPDGARRDEVSSPVDRAAQSSPAGKERRLPSDHRKGGRRQEKGDKPPYQDRESHDHRNRPHHRKENSRRERVGESEHQVESSRTARPERLTSTEDEEYTKDEHDYHDLPVKGPPRRDQHEETRPPLLGTA